VSLKLRDLIEIMYLTLTIILLLPCRLKIAYMTIHKKNKI